MKPEPPEVIEIKGSTVACDGGGGTNAAEQRANSGLGHPRVFLTVDAEGKVECPYCDRLYQRAKPV